MLHRRPDYQGYWLSEKKNIFFDHNRLSILDLSKKAAQPMFLNDKERIIVFNGEILFQNDCIFEKNIIDKLFYGLDRGYSNSERLFSLALFEIWRREYRMVF